MKFLRSSVWWQDSTHVLEVLQIRQCPFWNDICSLYFFQIFGYRQPLLRLIPKSNPFRAVPVYRDPPEDESPREASPQDPMLLCSASIHAAIRDLEGPLYAGDLDLASNARFLLCGVWELGFEIWGSSVKYETEMNAVRRVVEWGEGEKSTYTSVRRFWSICVRIYGSASVIWKWCLATTIRWGYSPSRSATVWICTVLSLVVSWLGDWLDSLAAWGIESRRDLKGFTGNFTIESQRLALIGLILDKVILTYSTNTVESLANLIVLDFAWSSTEIKRSSTPLIRPRRPLWGPFLMLAAALMNL